jgi:hypothetical protein
MKDAFKRLFVLLPMPPWKIFSDKGGEFCSAEMRRFFAEYDIAKHEAQNYDVKASIAERMIKTVKHRLYRYFTEKKTLRWLEAIPKITKGINNTVNRNLGMRPIDVNFLNAQKVRQRLYGTAYAPMGKPTLKEGDVVRVVQPSNAFKKGYLPNFSQSTYNIKQVKRRNPPVYKIEYPEGSRTTEVEGNWYKEELAKAAHEVKRIEKVLRTRGGVRGREKEYLVKWVGEPIKTASWIDEQDLSHYQSLLSQS